MKDVCSNRIGGYAIDRRKEASLAVRALENALMQRGYPEGVIVYSDRGSQFRSRKFQQALKRHKLTGFDGACGDNAAMESLFSLLQKNVLDCRRGLPGWNCVSRSLLGSRGINPGLDQTVSRPTNPLQARFSREASDW